MATNKIRPGCRGCAYDSRTYSTSVAHTCEHGILTGELRDCPIDDVTGCQKKKLASEFPPEQIEKWKRRRAVIFTNPIVYMPFPKKYSFNTPKMSRSKNGRDDY